ncbi:sensor histidine kinase [Nocardia huaxiensis]|nr:sensor histidine kinase [Nocardia huaxiensis]
MAGSVATDRTVPIPDPAALVTRKRLRQFVLAAQANTVFLLGLAFIMLWLRPGNYWTVAVIVLLLLDGLILAAMLRLVRQGRFATVVTTIAVLVWVSSIAGSYLTPATLSLHLVIALLPAIFVVPYVARRRLPLFAGATVGSVVASAVVAIPVMEYPPLPARYATVAGLAAVSVLIMLVLWHTADTLGTVARAARLNAQALTKSQRLLAERAEQLAASRARLVEATDAERRRLERDLHDGAQQHLVAVAVTLQLARQLASPECERLLAEAGELLQTAIAEIRRLAHGIYPVLLAQGGLRAALPAAAVRCPIPVNVHVEELGRYRAEVETALYYCCLEALQNAAKHGGPRARVSVSAWQSPRTLTVTVSDDGVGFDPATTGSGAGLTNMTDRLAVIGGTLSVRSAPGVGTRVTATVPTEPISGAAAAQTTAGGPATGPLATHARYLSSEEMGRITGNSPV